MDFIPLLKSRLNALRDCAKSSQLPPEKRQKMQQNLQILEYSPWAIKGTLLLGIMFAVNWKKEVPFSRRELPLAVGAILVSAASDFLFNDYVWRQHEGDIVKLTGFKNGIYVSPERMEQMKLSMARKNLGTASFDDEFEVEEDEPSK